MKAKQIRVVTLGMADALLVGPWELEPMATRLAEALEHRWGWLRPLARRLIERFPSPPACEVLAQAIACDDGFQKAIRNGARPRIVRWFSQPSIMRPTFNEWQLPGIDSANDLAEFLGITYSQLQWLADCEGRQGHGRELNRQHYRSYWLRKPTGGWRLVEEPLYLLKTAQRCLLHGILDRVPLHPAACAFTASRSVIDYAAPHVGRKVVLHLDIRNFFPSIRASRIHAMLTTLGFAVPVARLMTGLCTSTVPLQICRQHEGGEIYSYPHLPQGAPSSPALANIAAFRLDCRLAAAARAAGATYTRYADDLAFSGDADFARGTNRFLPLVWRIVYDEGFKIHHRKTRVMHQSVRQRLCGLVVNERINVDRQSYDKLKAILTNCLRHGLETQNHQGHPDFHEHLRGRIAYVGQINPVKGARLLSLFDALPVNLGKMGVPARISG